MLHLARGLDLPDDFVTKTCAILAQRRKGKTYTASVLAEELVKAGQPWVALDPTGAWWGLRSSADGEKPGLPVVILGGKHGDIPIDRGSGRLVAQLVIEHPGWYVVDFGLFETRAAEREFATEFADTLYRLKGQHSNDFPLHLFVDEADMFVPQDRETGDLPMLGAFQSIVRRGGLRGLGTTLISQRPALVNKSVLVQLDMLIVLRLVAGNDQDYLKKNYFDRQGTKEQVAELMGSMASLSLGEAWLWEPGEDLFVRTQIRERRTFNSSATPKPGETRIEPKRLADVDLLAVREQMAATIEKVKAIDPVELNRRIKELEIELAAERARQPIAPEPVIDEVEVVPPAVWEVFETMRSAAVAIDDSVTAGRVAWNEIDAAMDALRAVRNKADHAAREQASAPRAPKPSSPQVQQPKTSSAAAAPLRGSKDSAAKRVMRVLAIHGPCTPGKLATLAGISPKSSTLRGALAELRRDGHVNTGHPITATPDGLTALGTPEPLPTGEALLNYWMSELGDSDNADRKVLSALVKAYPANLTPEELEAETGISQGSSTTRGALAKLRKLGLAQKGARRANDEFMEAINS